MRPRSIKVSDDLWRAAQEKADERGEVLSEVMRAALERYVSKPTKERTERRPQ